MRFPFDGVPNVEEIHLFLNNNQLAEFELHDGFDKTKNDWKRFNIDGKTVYLRYIGIRSTQAANQDCKDLGAHLPLPTNDQENKYYRKAFNKLGAKGRVAIDANDLQTEGVYVKSDGTKVDYTNWSYREPNNAHEKDGEDYLAMLDTKWYDYHKNDDGRNWVIV